MTTELQDEIRARTGSPAAPLRPHHTFERAAERWLAKLDAPVADGIRLLRRWADLSCRAPTLTETMDTVGLPSVLATDELRAILLV